MRLALKPLCGQEVRVRALFAKKGKMGARRRAVLLLVVCTEADDVILSDHLWVNYTRPWWRLEMVKPLTPGDIVLFTARVKRYKRFIDSLVYEFDYGLGRVKELSYGHAQTT